MRARSSKAPRLARHYYCHRSAVAADALAAALHDETTPNNRSVLTIWISVVEHIDQP